MNFLDQVVLREFIGSKLRLYYALLDIGKQRSTHILKR